MSLDLAILENILSLQCRLKIGSVSLNHSKKNKKNKNKKNKWKVEFVLHIVNLNDLHSGSVVSDHRKSVNDVDMVDVFVHFPIDFNVLTNRRNVLPQVRHDISHIRQHTAFHGFIDKHVQIESICHTNYQPFNCTQKSQQKKKKKKVARYIHICIYLATFFLFCFDQSNKTVL
ncbi:hypothetical protein RFI_10844 [Reticulomyxa filosa]|uniref:Uncharacterized protein n=1 Tax=Reticulomyxa filosa TaxID=46433 RepID=X6NJZ0_RETFI|nr:hypothetical protein RFI_10844 [Reticulomyxa filosa]|eukprot:ETO26291.1 hypothetical protein RFI_10844 [Reticulomyxa filosa]